MRGRNALPAAGNAGMGIAPQGQEKPSWGAPVGALASQWWEGFDTKRRFWREIPPSFLRHREGGVVLRAANQKFSRLPVASIQSLADRGNPLPAMAALHRPQGDHPLHRAAAGCRFLSGSAGGHRILFSLPRKVQNCKASGEMFTDSRNTAPPKTARGKISGFYLEKGRKEWYNLS